MPLYDYECSEHGVFEVFQRMNDEHAATCVCGKTATRVFCSVPVHGDLPNKDQRPGKTRAELFDNLAKEGLYSKEWREKDEPNNKQWTDAGFKEKLVMGWTPALEKTE